MSEKEWTSLSGCIKKEGLSNEQKFILLAFRPEFRIYAKEISDQEIMEKLVIAIYTLAKSQKNPSGALHSVINALEHLESDINA